MKIEIKKLVLDIGIGAWKRKRKSSWLSAEVWEVEGRI